VNWGSLWSRGPVSSWLGNGAGGVDFGCARQGQEKAFTFCVYMLLLILSWCLWVSRLIGCVDGEEKINSQMKIEVTAYSF